MYIYYDYDYDDYYYYRMQSSAQGSVIGAVSLCFLFVYEIFREPLNGYAPNSHGRRVWSFARTSLKVDVKGQGHQGQKKHFPALRGLRAVCVWSNSVSL